MIGSDFTYNSKKLSDLNLKMYDPENKQQWVSREISKSEANINRQKSTFYGIKYSDTLPLNFLIMKDYDKGYTQSEMRFTEDEINNVLSWLTSAKTPKELTVFDGTQSATHYFGVFSDAQPYILMEDCYGIYLTFTCNAPCGFSDTNTVNCTLNASGTATCEFNNQSAECEEYLKPVIKISGFTGGEKITITKWF